MKVRNITRRQLLRALEFGALGGLLVACSPDQSAPAGPLATAEQPPPTATSAPTTMPATEPPPAPATTSVESSSVAATSQPPEVPEATAAPSLSWHMAAAAGAFLDALDADQRAKAAYAFTDAERLRWHWTTPSNFPRNGLPLRDMNAGQREQAISLLRTGTSEAGYQKALDIMSLQNDLGNDPELYYVTVFGTPGASEPWSWRFEGHHFSRHATLTGEQVAIMPFFLGAWPTVANSGLRAMAREEDAAREVVTSLTGASRSAAIFRERTMTNHVTSNKAYVTALDLVGIPLSELATDQRELVDEIVNAYLSTLPDPIGAAHLDQVRASGPEQVRFGWAGNLEPRRPHYYRLQGPTFLLEFDNSRNGGTHIHSVWREFAEDFGQRLLS